MVLSVPPSDKPRPTIPYSTPTQPRIQSRQIGNFPLLPLRTKTRGPAYTLPTVTLPANESPDADNESYDILDEVLSVFRANTFFRNFELQGARRPSARLWHLVCERLPLQD